MKSGVRLQQIAPLFLVLLAAALRFYRLNAQDIWGDEAFSILLSQQSLDKVIAGAADTHPPLYPLLLFFWLKLVGSSAFATRALSALVGILAVPLILVLAKRLTPRSRVPWCAAFLVAISPLLIYYSQETRMYELVAVLSLASMVLLPFPENWRRNRAWGYFLSALLALYTHYSAFFVLAAQNILFAIQWFRQRHRLRMAPLRTWLLMQGLLVVAYIPWVAVQSSFLGGKASARFDEWGWRGIEMIFGKTFLAFGVGLTVGDPLAQIGSAAFVLVAALGVVASARARESSAWLAPLYFVVPVVVAYVVNPVMPFFFERYVLVALPGFYLTVARGFDFLAQRRPLAAIGVSGFLVFCGVLALANYYFDDSYAKGKYGQMMAYVRAHAQPGDALVLNNPLQKPLYEYYAPRGIPAYYLPDVYPLEDPRGREQLERVARDHTRLWLVMFGNQAEYDPTGYLGRWLGAHAFKTFFGGFVDASLTLYVTPGASGTVQRSLRATLGESIRLIGYDLDRTEVSPGQTLLLTLRWQATASIAKRYTVFAHLIGALNPTTQSFVWAQMDGEPVGDSRATTTWQVGETIDDRYGLLVAPNTPPGEYQIEVGMYDPATLVRLPPFDESGARMADDRVLLGTVRVLAP